MTVGEFIPYARDFFRLDYPGDWRVRENRPVGQTYFSPPDENTGPYPAGIALMTIPETGVSLDMLLRTGLFFITRDLDAPSIARVGEQRDDDGDLTWHRLLVRGRAPGAPPLDVTKHVAVTRPGPGILVLALYGPAERIGVLEGTFDTVRRSVQVVQ